MVLSHTKGLFANPDREWEKIRNENISPTRLYFSHVLLLALIPPISAFIGTTQIGWQIADEESVKLTAQSALQLCTMFYMAILAGIFILGKFIDFFSQTYEGQIGKITGGDNGVTLAGFAATPLFLVGIVAIYPVIWVNMIASVVAVAYSVYLLYEGLPILMKIPAERGFLFASSVLTVALVMLVALMAITVVIWVAGFGPIYTT